MSKTVSLKDFAKVLDKEIKSQVKDVQKAAAKALNASARKARTAVANQESKTLQFKSKRFKNAIKIQKATRDNLNVTISFPNTASEVERDGKEHLMIPLKSGLKKIGYSKDNIVKGLAPTLLKYANSHPMKTAKRVSNPNAFFKLKSSKTGQDLIAARDKNDRKKMNWLFAGRPGKEPDFLGTVQKTVDKNLNKDFERELKKITDKRK